MKPEEGTGHRRCSGGPLPDTSSRRSRDLEFVQLDLGYFDVRRAGLNQPPSGHAGLRER